MQNTRKEDTTPATKADIALVLQNLGALSNDVGGLKKDVSGLKDDVGGLKDDVGNLKTDVGTLKRDVGTLKKDVSTLQGDVGTLQGDVGTLKNDVGSLQKAVAEHEKVMRAQFTLVFDHIDRGHEEMRQHFDEKFDKLDDACFDKSIAHDNAIRNLDRRVHAIERRVGLPS